MKSLKCKMLPLLFVLLVLLTGCMRDGEVEPTIPRWHSLRQKAEYLTVIAQGSDDFALLEECVNLKYLDLTGSTCYDDMLAYAQAHPQVEVIYTAPLGKAVLKNTETSARLEPGSYSAQELQRELKYLPRLTALELPKTTLSGQELEAIRSAYPDLHITYTVELLGQEYSPDVDTLDLSDLEADTLESAVGQLSMLSQLQTVKLPQSLTMEQVKDLTAQFPEVRFQYSFDLFGQTLSTDMDRVEYTNVSIGNAGEAQIRAALDIMPHCTYFKLENCGLDNEVLASIRDDYPNTKIVWRVNFGGQYSLMTDETTLRTVYGVENSSNSVLKYCTGLKYIDMGHNTTLTDISFASYMPDLEILILSGSSIRNVDALANCKNLVFLEMANCLMLEDISALKNCTSLRFLNIGFAKVQDISPIEDLPLERFVYLGPKIDKETQDAYIAAHPDCWVRFTGSDPLSLGWKYDDVGVTRSEYYKFIRQVFDLDDVDKRLAQQAAKEEAKREEEEAKNNPATPAPEPTTPAPTESPAPPATEPPAAPTPAPETPPPAPET